jgi:hypothetical protein
MPHQSLPAIRQKMQPTHQQAMLLRSFLPMRSGCLLLMSQIRRMALCWRPQLRQEHRQPTTLERQMALRLHNQPQ